MPFLEKPDLRSETPGVKQQIMSLVLKKVYPVDEIMPGIAIAQRLPPRDDLVRIHPRPYWVTANNCERNYKLPTIANFGVLKQ
ncbi:hypothetical protein ACFS5N_17630 [Mucilaginibacter ximonensis]|uniref:Uncharacterized protein n=1 Tax=Mucilaginibacter ximonensis TaxID=538021 RepID=A0ABW5YHN6_9SPHI